jgi:hypothetical protein
MISMTEECWIGRSGAMTMMVACHMYLAIIKAITDAVAQPAVENFRSALARRAGSGAGSGSWDRSPRPAILPR